MIEHDGRTQVITAASNAIRSYDLHTGDVIWEASGLTGNVTPSPVTLGDVVYCMSGYQGHSLMALKFTETGAITGTDAIKWSREQETPYVPSPVLYGSRLYFTQSNQNILTCVNANTGHALLDRTRLPEISNVYASQLLLTENCTSSDVGERPLS